MGISRSEESQFRERFRREVIPLQPRLYGHALQMTRNPFDAEDLVQETMLRAYIGYPAFRQGTNATAWLHRIMTNLYINDYRRRRRRPSICSLADVPDDQVLAAGQRAAHVVGSAEDQMLAKVPDTEIMRAMRQLPLRWCQAVYYADVEGFRYKEIAQIMGSPVGTVMSRLHRGRAELRRQLAGVALQRGYRSALAS